MSEIFTEKDEAGAAEVEPEQEGTAPPRAPGRRRNRTVLVAAAFVLVTAVAVVGALGLGGDGDAGTAAPPRAGSTVAVTRTTLVERTAVDGTLGYGTEIPLPAKASGTVTWLPEAGTVAERGDTLLRVDDRPVVLLYGALPMYRELGMTTGTPAPDTTGPSNSPAPGGAGGAGGKGGTDGGTGTGTSTGGSTDGGTSTSTGTGTDGGRTTATPPRSTPPQPLRGMDVLQFESNLAALGYTGFTVDERFTSGTERAVERWQKSLGLPETGRVGLGDVVYASGRIRLGQASVRLGAAAGENVLGYTGTTRKVVVDASAREASWAVRGTGVTVGLPDGTSVKGRVASVGRQATPPEGDGTGGPPTVPVTITLADQRALGRLESGPVSVEYVGRKRENVLTVPVAALVALAEGGHGLETEDGRFVSARTGLFADGLVEVSGPALRAGLKVRIPQ
ncbi:peptidoglycan-binding protein [Streptomyces sp. NPDC056549]|uniref:peptidoglycan-binding protein n=1 Tax=Streptomyces sp. NPDC056549 TaxID=3345864 RepID=UPI0036A6C96A